MKPDEVENYIHDVMGKVFPPDMQKGNTGFGFPAMNEFNPKEQPSTTGLNESVFETHDHVYVVIPIKNQELLKDMKITHTSNQLIIKHMPTWEEQHTVILPSLVRRKGSRANYKDRTLEIRFQKNLDWHYTEIDIQED